MDFKFTQNPLGEEKKNEILQKISKYLHCEKYEKCQIVTVTDGVFEKISTEKSPQGIISFIKHLDFFETCNIIIDVDFFQNSEERMILLSGIRDPLNLGAVIRSAVAFGIDKILLTSDTVDLYNPKTVRAAMGALFHVSALRVKDTASLIAALKKANRRVLAAELRPNAISLMDAKLQKKDVVVIGNEGHGIDESISKLCNNSVYLPISPKAESLNAASAAAIFMWEQCNAKG